jgi:hypothetical protein
MKKTYSSKMRLDEWSSFFIEFIFPDNLNNELADPFLKYLADLEILVPCAGGMWEWKGCDPQIYSENLKDVVQVDLESLCKFDSGFALPFFIGYKEIDKKPLEFILKKERFAKDSPEKRKSHNQGERTRIIEPASDLSNLQIVKKVGKQLQPFLQIEESIVSRLVGNHVSKQDAQKLFHYIFGNMNTKAEPRVWEQLSRKRHR